MVATGDGDSEQQLCHQEGRRKLAFPRLSSTHTREIGIYCNSKSEKVTVLLH